ncbi:MAG: M28 family peptidase, partial [Acidobacteria bacterium]|nr:M28 family peptidase [Acidobacteriota bacterium]
MRLDVSSWAPRFLLVAVVLLALAALRPPSPVPPGAPAGEFSAHRAAIHLESIAREPHVLGSAQLAKVREYLVAQLEALGLEAQIQEATAVRSGRGGLIGVGPVANVYARIPGSTGTSTVLLAAHYDSMPFTAGAADDGAAVAALLETARALAAGPPL